MEATKQQNISEEANDIFASKKKLAYKTLDIVINETLYPGLPRNISFPIEIDPEYNFVDGVQIFKAEGSLFHSNFAIRTDYETILSDKSIYLFRAAKNLNSINGNLLFSKKEGLFYPCLVKGSGKKIYLDIKNINWSDGTPSIGSLTFTITFKQTNNVITPKYVYDILKVDFTQNFSAVEQEHYFKLNSSYKEIIGISFVKKRSEATEGIISLNTNNFNIINKAPMALFNHGGFLSVDYFTAIYVNKINNIEFNLLTNCSADDYSAYFLVRKPFVQPY